MENIEKVNETYSEIRNLEEITNLLHWDQEVMMPEEGAEARSKQLSLLSKLMHRSLNDEELSSALKKIEKEKLSQREKATFREVKREHEKAAEVPEELQSKISSKESECLQNWKKAREENDFEIVKNDLKELVELKRKYADHVDSDREPYRVLLDDYEPYIEFETIEEVMEKLRQELTDLMEDLRNSKQVDDTALRGSFDTEKQETANQKILDILGFEEDRTRFDISEHPFTVGNQFDARLTSRYNEEELSESILPTVHEFGHTLYFLGTEKQEYSHPKGQTGNFSIHESQSRLWENHIARSEGFWKLVLPELRDYFPQLEEVTPRECYEYVNRYNPENKIRVNADEASYHLHIVMRFEIGRDLINGDLEVEELPETWNDKMEQYLKVRPENDKEGVLQDMHWYQGAFGYFTTYSMGSVLASQIYAEMEEEIDDLDSKIEEGDFEPVRDWLRQNIHSKGRLYTTPEIIEDVTGEEISPEPFLNYIDEKFTRLYS